MYCCHSILEYYNLFSGVKLNIRLFVLLLLTYQDPCVGSNKILFQKQFQIGKSCYRIIVFSV